MSGHESHGGGGGGGGGGSGLHVVELAQEGAKHVVAKPLEVIITQLPIAFLFALIGKPLGTPEA